MSSGPLRGAETLDCQVLVPSERPWSRASAAVCERYGCEFPIFGLSHDPEVAAAITLAGGVGVWAAARQLPAEIINGMILIRKLIGDRCYGVNLMLPVGLPQHGDRKVLEESIPERHRQFVDSIYDKYGVPKENLLGERNRIVRSEEFFQLQVDAAMSGDARLFAIAIGSRPEVARRAKAKGMDIVALVGSPRHVGHAREMSADLIVAQGADAGGHVGTVGTLSLVPRVVELAGGVPVLGAGGIGSGRQAVAAVALGAAGIWTGTIWLGTREAALPEPLVRKLIAATCEDTVVTRGSSGKPMRQIRTAWSDEWARDDAPQPLPMPWQDLLVGSIEGSIDRHGIEPLMHTPAGQSVEWIREQLTVAETMRRLVRDAESVITSLYGDRSLAK